MLNSLKQRIKARTLIVHNIEMLSSDGWIGHPINRAAAEARHDGQCTNMKNIKIKKNPMHITHPNK